MLALKYPVAKGYFQSGQGLILTEKQKNIVIPQAPFAGGICFSLRRQPANPNSQSAPAARHRKRSASTVIRAEISSQIARCSAISSPNGSRTVQSSTSCSANSDFPGIPDILITTSGFRSL